MKRTQRLTIVSAVAMLLALAASAGERPIRFERLGLEDGLSQSSALTIFQDSVGYLWIGTEDGLNRYDGLGFRAFKRDARTAGAIPGSFVWAIDEDRHGDLWIATEDGGVARLDRASGRFSTVDLAGERATRALHVDDDGTVWIGMRSDGIRRIDGATREVRAYRSAIDGLPDDHVYALLRDAAGRLWVGTDAGIARYDASEDRFRVVHAPGAADGISGERVRSLASGRHGHLWVGTFGNGLNRIDPASGTVRVYRHDREDPASLAHDRVRAIRQDNAGRIWVGTSAGLDLYDPRRDAFEHYAHEASDAASLADDHVMSIAQDRGGVLWVGTRFGGVHKWHPRAWQFGHRRSIDDTDGGDPSRVTAFTEDARGRQWVGAFGEGVTVYDRNGDSVERFRHDPDDPFSLGSDRVTALLTDHHGAVWVGTLDHGLSRLDAETGRFERFVHDEARPDSLPANAVSSLVEDVAGVMWVGTFGGGVARFDHHSESFTRFGHDPADGSSIGSDRITSVAMANGGLLWVGTHGAGVSLLDPTSGRATRFTHDPALDTALGSDLVYSVFVDERGALWVGTSDGLSRLDRADIGSGEFRTYRQRDGLPNNVVYSIQQDRTGRLWLSTNQGLACLDPSDGRVQVYDRGDGLQDLEFNSGAAFTRRDGEMLFGGINGFNAFVPEALRGNENAPAVVVASAARDHEPISGPVDRLDTLQLGYRNRVVSFEFAALDFENPARNRFAYRLDGFDEGWIDGGLENRVTYTNLDPGRYALRVRAANADGTWNEQGTTIALHVAAPPWRSPWAYGGYTFGILGCLFGFVHVQRRKIAREEEHSRMLEEQVQHRTRELASRTRELESVNRRLATASLTDSLTGFANRRFLIEYLEKEISLVKRRYKSAGDGGLAPTEFDLAFMMIDLDNFKSINDTFGHNAGDEVLRQLRTILDDACRSSDIVIRWGGDEFLIVARDQDPDRIEQLAERIRVQIANHAFRVGDGQVVRTTCSIGYACYPFIRGDVDALNWEQVIAIADRALYVSKRSGRNAWVGLESTPTTDDTSLLAGLRNQLEGLVNTNQLQLHTSIDRDSRNVAWTLED